MFSRLRFLPRGSDESVSPSDMVRGLVPSMVRCKCCDFMTWLHDWFLPCSNISVEGHFLGEWRNLVNYQEIDLV